MFEETENKINCHNGRFYRKKTKFSLFQYYLEWAVHIKREKVSVGRKKEYPC
jgi:hypothetical protein